MLRARMLAGALATRRRTAGALAGPNAVKRKDWPPALRIPHRSVEQGRSSRLDFDRSIHRVILARNTRAATATGMRTVVYPRRPRGLLESRNTPVRVVRELSVHEVQRS